MYRRILQQVLQGILAAPLVFPAALLSQPISFVEVTAESGLGEYEIPNRGFGAGIAAADFDDDGLVDLFVPTDLDTPNRLYRNLGEGHFEDVAAARGLAGITRDRVALWLDYNADHRLDLLVLGDCYSRPCDDTSLLRLHRQTVAGTFEDVTTEAGLTDTGHTRAEHRSGLAAGDVNGDGFVDFVAGFWEGRLHLYLTRGNGTFADVSLEAGFDNAVLGYHQPVMVDWNSDGLLDIYAAVDFTENRLFLNQGVVDGMPTFVDVAVAAGCANAMNDMGVTLGDVDEDGDPDLYVTNIFREGMHNVLLRNDSTGGTAACSDISMAAGVEEGGWGWGTTFFDGNNNGFLDLGEVNGWRLVNSWDSPPRLFVHQGTNPPTFLEEAATAGLTQTSWGSTLLAFDYDRDGDLDLVGNQQIGEQTALLQGALVLYQNQLLHQNQLSADQLSAGVANRHYLVIRPRMTGRNHRAIGTRIAVEAGGRTLFRWITAGTSYLGQEPAEAFFGLGSATVAERVTITWPSGEETVLLNVMADQMKTVTLSEPRIFGDGFEWGDTLAWSLTVP